MEIGDLTLGGKRRETKARVGTPLKWSSEGQESQKREVFV